MIVQQILSVVVVRLNPQKLKLRRYVRLLVLFVGHHSYDMGDLFTPQAVKIVGRMDAPYVQTILHFIGQRDRQMATTLESKLLQFLRQLGELIPRQVEHEE